MHILGNSELAMPESPDPANSGLALGQPLLDVAVPGESPPLLATSKSNAKVREGKFLGVFSKLLQVLTNQVLEAEGAGSRRGYGPARPAL